MSKYTEEELLKIIKRLRKEELWSMKELHSDTAQYVEKIKKIEDLLNIDVSLLKEELKETKKEKEKIENLFKNKKKLLKEKTLEFIELLHTKNCEDYGKSIRKRKSEVIVNKLDFKDKDGEFHIDIKFNFNYTQQELIDKENYTFTENELPININNILCDGSSKTIYLNELIKELKNKFKELKFDQQGQDFLITKAIEGIKKSLMNKWGLEAKLNFTK